MMTRIGPCILICGDNARYLEKVKASVAIVSDPPYGINYQHSGHCGKSGVPSQSRAVANDNVPFDPTPLMRFDNVLIFGANHYAKRLPDGGAWHVWDKTGGGRGPNDTFADAEFIWTKHKTKTRVFSHLWKGFLKASERCERRVHPTQKPVELMEWCIGFMPPDAVIFDPFMGAGSTAVAALRAGRRFIGIELEQDHYESAVARVTREHERLKEAA